jgi:diguanylate cyclase (GGDEF)-like protein/PAS domain S-box-containing protein
MHTARLSAARPQPRERARTLSYLFFGGAILGFAAVVFFPLPPGTDISGTLITIAITFAVGLTLFLGAKALPGWVIPGALAIGTVVISLDIYFAGEIRTNDEMFYLWVAFYAFYFLPKKVAAAELILLGACYAIAIVLRHEPDSSTRWVITMGTLTMAGTLTARLVGQLERWVERSRQREEALGRAEARFRSAFDDAAIGMALVDLQGRWLQVNEALAQLTGYSADRLIGMSFRDLTPDDEVSKDVRALEQVVAGQRNVYVAEKRYRRADEGIVWISLSVSLVRGPDGNPLHLISQMQDITDRKAAERELADRALHDPLTGLPNRLLFLDRVQVAISRIERTLKPVAVFFIDLDRFKLVNDSLGHSIGDRMLNEVAWRLQQALRPNDTVSRFGGDEFTLLCENIDERAAKNVAERIARSLMEPFVIDGRELFATASIGASICRDHHVEAEAMLRDADVAMYRAKEQGRSHFVIFDGGMRSRATERLDLDNDLRRAIDRDELRLLYQPLVELDSGRIFGVEALVRWQHPRRGLLAPGQFIALAEESGLIVPLGQWVMREACEQARRWNDAGHDLVMSINLSPRQLADPQLPEVVSHIVGAAGVRPEQICLEITESATVDTGIGPLVELKRLGVRLALDDFGTGFSSLTQIRRLPPVDTLKIDRSFIEDLGRAPADVAIVAAVIGMARALDLAVIAEGIENGPQVRALRDLGCERGQGFYFGRPAEAHAIEELLGSAALGELRI